MINWEKVARTNTHPTRIAALEMFDESADPLSPVQIARALHKDVGHVGYHVRKLQEFGFITLVSERPVRGAVEHFYLLEAKAS